MTDAGGDDRAWVVTQDDVDDITADWIGDEARTLDTVALGAEVVGWLVLVGASRGVNVTGLEVGESLESTSAPNAPWRS